MLRKTYTLLLVFFLSMQVLPAQTVDGIPLDQIDAKYLQLIGIGQRARPTMSVTLDYGQVTTSIQRRGHPILDDFGQPLLFNSMMDALNFMAG